MFELGKHNGFCALCVKCLLICLLFNADTAQRTHAELPVSDTGNPKNLTLTPAFLVYCMFSFTLYSSEGNRTGVTGPGLL